MAGTFALGRIATKVVAGHSDGHPGTDAIAMYRLLIADDHPLFRAALAGAVADALPGAEIDSHASLDSLLAALERDPARDLVLLDLRMPGVRGYSSLIQLRGQYPALPVAIVSGEDSPAVIRRAIEFGAAGYIPKSAALPEIAAALAAILDGDVWLPAQARDAAPRDPAAETLAAQLATLTPQQFKVLMALADGRLNKQIGGDLAITEATVKAHVTAILRKLGLYRRTQVALIAQRLMGADASPLPGPADYAAAGPDPDADG